MPRAGRVAQPPAKPPVDETLEEDKARARELYEKQSASTADIAKLVNRTQTTIIQWVGAGSWIRNREERTETARAALIVQEAAERATKVAIVERVNVEMQARVLVEHRTDIKKMRTAASKLWEELQQYTEDEASLDDRITMLKKLSEASKNLIVLERQAFGIQGALEDPTKPADPSTGLNEAATAMGALLGKFASVLGKSQEAKPLDIVDEVK